MLEEFKKINNIRQQRKYLDKKAIYFDRNGIKEEDVESILALSSYLDSIHFWQRYESLFDEIIVQAKAMKLEKEMDQKIKELANPDIFHKNLSILTSYEKDVVVDGYDANKIPIRSILVRGKAYLDKDRYASIQECKALLLEAMEKKGSLEVHYFNGFRTLKRIKL